MFVRHCCRSLSNLVRRSYHAPPPSSLCLSGEVKSALNTGRPLVALESTIITHGMPYPHNRDTAMEVEEIVRSHGATPATVAVLDGKLHVGLESRDLELLAQGDQPAVKTSRRDMAVALARGYMGGTTVSGTMLAAHMAGIHVFVTGGIGGVHRGATQTFDVSADLTELGRTPLAVVCAGVKSILDIPATLEYLETQGVAVLTYANEGEDFPAFFTRRSGFKAPYNVQTAEEAADIIACSLDLFLRSGLVIGVPVPEQHAADGELIEAAIQKALVEASEQGIEGKAVTPFILQRVNQLTEGASLKANIALIRNNAMIGSQIACALANRRPSGSGVGSTGAPKSGTGAPKSSTGAPKSGTGAPRSSSSAKVPSTSAPASSTHAPTYSSSGHLSNPGAARVVVIGGTNIDFTCTFGTDDVKANGGTYGGRMRQSFGGVGRNTAEGLTSLGCAPLFVSAVGEDLHAQAFFQHAQQRGMDTRGVRQLGNSATYCAVLRPCGNLLYGIGDFDAHTYITPQHVSQFEGEISGAALVVIDGNLPIDTISYVTEVAANNQVPVWFDAADVGHVRKIFATEAWNRLTYTSPNLNELRMMHNLLHGRNTMVTEGSNPEGPEQEVVEEAIMLMKPLLPHIHNVLTTVGKHGVVMGLRGQSDFFPVKGAQQTVSGEDCFIHYAVPTPPESVISVSGAGDCLNCAVIWELLQGSGMDRCMEMGLAAAQLSLQHNQAVPQDFSPQTVTEKWQKLYGDVGTETTRL